MFSFIPSFLRCGGRQDTPASATSLPEYADPLVRIEGLLANRRNCRILELEGGDGVFNFAQRLAEKGWQAHGYGRRAGSPPCTTYTEDYRFALMQQPPGIAEVIIARLSFYPRLSPDSPRVYPWDQLEFNSRGVSDLCSAQHVADPNIFPVRRALCDHGLFIRTMRASGVGTVAEIPPADMRRSGFRVQQEYFEEFDGHRYKTTVYEAIPLLGFGNVFFYLPDGDCDRKEYEKFLREMIANPTLRFNRITDSGVTQWQQVSERDRLAVLRCP